MHIVPSIYDVRIMTIEADLLSSAKRAMFTKALRNAVCVWGGDVSLKRQGI